MILPGFMASANAFMKKIRFVELINETVVWDQKQWHISPGNLLKAIVLNTFTDRRAPLYKLSEAYQGIDTKFLFGDGVTYEQITDSAVGEALERLHAANAGKLFQTLCLSVFDRFKIPIKRMHSDTTSISFYGNYEETEEDESLEDSSKKPKKLTIARGYNKDRRPNCKQLVLGKITNEAGIPLVCKSMDGNTSDVEWNEKAISLAREIQRKQKQKDSTYVADCKLMTQKLFKLMTGDDGILFISRVPANFASKLESRMTTKAYSENNWEVIGKISEDDKACSYELQEFVEEVYGQTVRLIVVKSSHSLDSFHKSENKRRIEIEKEITELNKKVFSCLEDARREWESFSKKHANTPYAFVNTWEKIETEKRPRGNPGKNPKPPVIIIEWSLSIELKEVKDDVMKKLRENAESFVLISNVPKDKSTAKDILVEYKGQIVVELNFKTLKSPALTATVFLEKPERIEALMMLIGVSLLLRALILYMLRKNFDRDNRKLKIAYTGGMLKTVTMGLFEYAMHFLHIEREHDGSYIIYYYGKERDKLRVKTFLNYLEMEDSNLLD